MRDWWNMRHQNRDTYYLGDSALDRIEAFLRIRAAGHVLNIGVGTGRCTWDMVKRGCKVDALDISEVALNNVADITMDAFTDPADLPSDHYDLAVCHLVMQHIDDATATALLRHALRSLKPAGVLALQYAAPRDKRLFSQDEKTRQEGMVWRTPAHAERLIAAAGGTITKRLPARTWAAVGADWHGCHVTR